MTRTTNYNDAESAVLLHARQRPAASHSLQHYDQQVDARHRCLESGLKMEMVFALSMELKNLFRAGMRSRGLQEQEIEHLLNSARR